MQGSPALAPSTIMTPSLTDEIDEIETCFGTDAARWQAMSKVRSAMPKNEPQAKAVLRALAAEANFGGIFLSSSPNLAPAERKFIENVQSFMQKTSASSVAMTNDGRHLREALVAVASHDGSVSCSSLASVLGVGTKSAAFKKGIAKGQELAEKG